MAYNAAEILRDLLDKFIEGISLPEKDSAFPDPDLLREEAQKYE